MTVIAATGVVARDDSYTMTQGTVLTIVAPGVLDNDTLPPGVDFSVEFIVETIPPNAAFTNLGNGSGGFILDMSTIGARDFTGIAEIDYSIHPGPSNVATVTVQVTPE